LSTEVVRSGFDAWTEAAKPFTKHPKETHYRVRFGQNLAFLWMKSPAPLGATVTRATLTLQMRGAASGSRVLNVHRAATSWKEGGTHWNNQPLGAGTAVQKTIPAYTNGYDVEIDVTPIVQAWANGTPNYGFRFSTDSTSTIQIYALASTAHPVLEVEWSDAPAKPSDLRPSEAATSLAKPHLTFTYLDVSGNTELAAVQVQVSATESFSSPMFDSGEVATQSSGLDLSQTAFSGLADDQVVYWRVRAKDGAGLWSVWSDPVQMSRRLKPTVEISNLGAGVVYDSTPLIIWDTTGSQTRYRVLVYDKADLSRPVHDSWQVESAEESYTLPAGVLRDDREYRLKVRVWDGWHREATPGDPTYSEAVADFHADTDAEVGPVASLVATQDDRSPWVTLEWTRSTTPDAFVLVRDGEVVARWDEPEELFVSGSTYRYKQSGARPNWTHTYEVRAVVNGRQSKDNPVLTYASRVEGLWLVDSGRGINVTLWGDDAGEWSTEDDASVYTPVGGTRAVRIVSGIRGHEGSLSGYLMEGFGKTFAEMEADLLALKSEPSRPVRIIAGDENFSALIGNISISPSPRTRSGRIVKDVSFSFWQVGPLPFKANI
jgi:hypothetical protein